MRVHYDQPLDKQIAEITKKLPGILSIKKCEMEGTLRIPNKFLGQTGQVTSKYVSKTLKESYTASDCVMEVAIVPGDYDAMMKELSAITKGDFSFDIVGAAVDAKVESGGGGGGGGKKGKGKGKGKGKK